MNKSKFYASVAMLALGVGSLCAQTTVSTWPEHLDRGLVAVPSQKGGSSYFLSWRLLATDDDGTTFDVLRNGEKIANNLDSKTNFVDNYGSASSQYQVVVKQDGVAVDTTEAVKPWGSLCRQIPLIKPAGGTTPDKVAYNYTPNDCSVGDVDGDGEYEIILKWDPSNSKDNSNSGYTGNVFLDCYKLDGTRLWQIDLGVNIRAGAHYTQFLVYDFDGDGKAEVICKTAPGSKDGQGNYVNSAATDDAIKNTSNTQDWRNSSGKIKGGQEYLTVFNGETGKAIHTVFYNPNRAMGYGGAPGWTANWDDRSGKTDTEYGNRGERYLACVAYLDGRDKKPSAVMSRGYYTYAFMWAVDFDGKELKTKWFHAAKSKTSYTLTDADGNTQTITPDKATRGSGSNTLYGNGNHNLSVADVDGDGCDEIVYGSAAVNNDGKLLYATGYGHGDAIHMSDLIPDRPGLEVFEVHEESPYGWDVHDAATGRILHSATGGSDNGRGMSADVSADNRGFEFWSANDRNIRSATTGDVVSEKQTSVNFRTYWDGDLFDEMLDGNTMDKWNSTGATRIYPISGKNFYDINSSSTCNSTKKTPNLQADILGDWREELILWDSRDSAHLNLFTTNVETNYRVPTLMHDPVYRLGVAWQNVAYNQPPHLGYYLPDLFKTEYIKLGEGDFVQTVTLGDSIQKLEYKYKNCARPTILQSIAPDGTVTSGKVMDGFSWHAGLASVNPTFTLEGKPSAAGTYKIIIKSGKNTVDSSIRNDTVLITCVDPTAIDAVTSNETEWVKLQTNVISDRIVLTLNSGKANGGKVSVALYNAAGAKVMGRSLNAGSNGNHTIGGLGRLADGVYLLTVKSAEKTYTQKLVKK